MTTKLFRVLFPCLLSLVVFNQVAAQNIPSTDGRLGEPRHLDLTYSLPKYDSKEEWTARAERLRKQILVSAGLWPTPSKSPIKATIFEKLDRGDYTVEKVYFESYTGFYVTGNLYRPKNTATQPKKLPAVLCPHGHWAYGRLENTALNSGPARAISFARQGYVAFSYDMVGYVDSSAISHKFADHDVTRREALWGINLLGLQLWNSIRSVDFLLALPEVDADRIACTGESGGGTQTFLLAAVDERIKVAAPVNMVSFIMQGGSLCENAPNLRIDTNNVEIAALMAPRPIMLVSATGDWTKNMLTSEYPAVRSIYRLFGAEDKVTAIRVNAPHNYNQESREAVYGWFAHWMRGRTETTPVKERNAGIPSLPELMVFFGRGRPDNELNEAQLSELLIEQRRKQFEESLPRDSSGLGRFMQSYGEAFKYSLLAEYPKPGSITTDDHPAKTANGVVVSRFSINRSGRGDQVEVTIRKPERPEAGALTLVLSAADLLKGEEATKARNNRDELINLLVQSGHSVASINCFPAYQNSAAGKYKFFTTYNRTDAANRIQDILTAAAYLKTIEDRTGKAKLNVVALDRSGLWALLARGLMPQPGAMVIDAAQFDSTSDEEFLKWLPIPGIRRAGDFTTATVIAPLAPLLIHNTRDKFQTAQLAEIYRRLGRAQDFQSQAKALSNAEILKRLSTN